MSQEVKNGFGTAPKTDAFSRTLEMIWAGKLVAVEMVLAFNSLTPKKNCCAG